MTRLQQVARTLGGEVCGNQVRAPGPGHSSHDRSLSFKFEAGAPGGFVVNSFAGDDPFKCKDYVREKLGLPPWRPSGSSPSRKVDGSAKAVESKRRKLGQEAVERDQDYAARQRLKARSLWKGREPIQGSPAETYLREARRYRGRLPATLGFLPARKRGHHPALIAAFGLPVELEPGSLSIDEEQVQGVLLTLLRPDGTAKAGTGRDKIMVGPSRGFPIALAPMNDLLGLAIAEGIENAASIHEATGLGAWAAGSASRIPTMAKIVPDHCEFITVAADDDEPGRKAAAAFLEAIATLGIDANVILPTKGAA